MTAIASRRRNRTIAALVAGILVLVAVPALGYLGYQAITNSRQARLVANVPTVEIPSTPTALLGIADADGQLTSLAVLVQGVDDGAGSIIPIPVGAKADTGAGGPIRRMADSFDAGGTDALVTDMESLMAMTFTTVGIIDASALADLLTPAGAVTVELAAAVVATVGGVDQEVVKAGRHSLEPSDVAAVLAARRDGESELDRLPRVRAIWNAVAAKISGGVGTPAAEGDDIQQFSGQLFAHPVIAWNLPAERIAGTKDNPEGLDLLEVNRVDIVTLMAMVAPSSLSVLLSSITVQIDSPFADPALAREAVARLLFAGANVMLVRQIDSPPPPTTVVRYLDPLDLEEARRYGSAIGEVSAEVATERVEGIDVQIVLGQSFADMVRSEAEAQASTTSSSVSSPGTDGSPTGADGAGTTPGTGA